MKTTIKDYGTHKIETNWIVEDIRCVECGIQGVWRATEGDYYVGEEHICVNCDTSFYVPSIQEADKEIVRQLEK